MAEENMNEGTDHLEEHQEERKTLIEYNILWREKLFGHKKKLPLFIKIFLYIPLLVAIGIGFYFVNLDMSAGTALNKKNYDEAVYKYEKLIRINPKEATYHWNLAFSYVEKGDILGAQKVVSDLKSMKKHALASDIEKSVINKK